jgi:hypothetical protein
MEAGMNEVALSIRQPWAWLILHGGKDVENRTWPASYYGPLLIHAGKGMTQAEYEFCKASVGARFPSIKLPLPSQLPRGGIVGRVKMVECVRESDSPWWESGCWAFILRDPKPLPFFPCKGSLKFFNVTLPWVTLS